MTKSSKLGATFAATAIAVAIAAPLAAQQSPQIDFKSVGRGAPVLVDAATLPVIGAAYQGQGFLGPAGPGNQGNAGNAGNAGNTGNQGNRGNAANQGAPAQRQFIGSAPPGQTPKGIEPLPRDMFTSDDFYKDKDLWSDPRYWRCNSTVAIEDSWTARGAIGDHPPQSAAWGRCDSDYPREAIVSPYPFKTAQEHWEALKAETKKRGGPTQHTYATVPGEWTGRYMHPGFTPGQAYWYRLRNNQVPTILSLLTPEYQMRTVQMLYHEGHDNAAQWPSQYCWPEGFMRRWHEFADWEHYITVTPDVVQILAGVARNFITNIHIDREFKLDGDVPYLSEQVPRWYGETIGFWDGDVLITWTSNIQGWKVHAAFEYSSRLQTVEIYSPLRNADGRFLGLNHEAVFYDPDALVEPIRIVRNLMKQGSFRDQPPFVFVECVQTIFPVDGRATPLTPGDVLEYEVPDMYGRPWAKIWERYFEQGMQRPEQEDIFSFE